MIIYISTAHLLYYKPWHSVALTVNWDSSCVAMAIVAVDNSAVAMVTPDSVAWLPVTDMVGCDVVLFVAELVFTLPGVMAAAALLLFALPGVAMGTVPGVAVSAKGAELQGTWTPLININWGTAYNWFLERFKCFKLRERRAE